MAMPSYSAYDFANMADERIPDSTPMKDFYRGKVVLLTGGTGALGQIYVEKFLR